MATPSGLQDKILKFMEHNDRVEVSQIASALGMRNKPVSRSVYALSEKCKVFKVGGHGQHGIWSLKAPVALDKPAAVIPTRYVPEFKPLTPSDYDIRGHMRMAVEGR